MVSLLRRSLLLFVLTHLFACISTQAPKNLLDAELSQFENIYSYGVAEYRNGELVLESTKNWFYSTKKTYKNFVLTAEILLPDVEEYSNSGILFRGQTKPVEGGVVAIGYQAEVDPSTRRWSGGFFDQGRRQWLHPTHPTRSQPDEKFIKNFIPEWTEELANAYKHLEWNRYRIECRGNEIKIFVNDILTTHVLDSTDSEGFIALQHHGSKKLIETGKTDNQVKFRNVFITELD
ncbi:DUF1080 domain-containing protein [Glaciecola sp. SC05]|uniref:3-keto-disaccharide hydrolase n=1 Tax=Glaciecola sp. SC05 TaxID=1987355 RepID=UPI0035273648